MNAAGGGSWRAFSAGSKPTGAPNPLAIETLRANDVVIGEGESAPRSKSWDEFTQDGATVMDVVVTVCDNAAAETCPIWPTGDGPAPRTLHWSFPDPAAATGSKEDRLAEFQSVFDAIRARIDDFLAGA